MHEDLAPLLTADQALARMLAGNERFVRGEAHFPTVQKDILAALAKQQRPYATVLGCSDSRVPPELIFDAGFGELFVIRVAGNVLSAEIMGTMQYAAMHLKTELFVVLGHEGCGAVDATLSSRHGGVDHPERIARLLESITPALTAIDPALPPDEQMHAAVEANVRWTMHQILETPEGQARQEEGRLKLVGAVYALDTGQVRILS